MVLSLEFMIFYFWIQVIIKSEKFKEIFKSIGDQEIFFNVYFTNLRTLSIYLVSFNLNILSGVILVEHDCHE